MNSETSKEFLQKYKLDSYSRAIPARNYPGKIASLAEYCDPVDSRKLHRVASEENEDNSSDSEKRYAQPQDSIVVKKVKQPKPRTDPSQGVDIDVYNLVQEPVEEDVLPQKKPSPKPRSAKNTTPQLQSSKPDNIGGEPDITNMEVTHKNNLQMSTETDIKAQIQKKRPGKKVVEIEYEVASAIRLVKPEVPSGRNVSVQDQDSNQTTIIPDKHVQSTPQSSSQLTKVKTPDNSLNSGIVVSLSSAPQSQHSPSYSMNQTPVPGGTEDTYQEPWDLKMKRIKQEQEKKAKKLAKRSDKLPSYQKTAVVYENTWDNLNQQQKIEKRMSCTRSMSQTSEIEIFHDALDSFPDQKTDNNPQENVEADQNPTGKLKPLPQNTYEDAWDLKNSLLEQKIREMQLQASAIYEEPWDSSKQQKQLHAKLYGSNPVPTVNANQQKFATHRSNSEAQDMPPDDTEPNAAFARGKHHSLGESHAKARGHGCNIGQRINPMIPLASQNWYHGNISREDAEKMLCVCKEGSYIVRISSDRRSYSLSIKSSRQYIHVQIDQRANEDGSICYILGKNSKEFCTIPEMIDYYTHHRVPLKGAEHITLLHPVECKWS